MEDKINKLKKAFGSKEGIIVLKTFFHFNEFQKFKSLKF